MHVCWSARIVMTWLQNSVECKNLSLNHNHNCSTNCCYLQRCKPLRDHFVLVQTSDSEFWNLHVPSSALFRPWPNSGQFVHQIIIRCYPLQLNDKLLTVTETKTKTDSGTDHKTVISTPSHCTGVSNFPSPCCYSIFFHLLPLIKLNHKII